MPATATKLTSKTVAEALERAGVNVDRVRTRGGTVEVLRGYFYRMGQSASGLAEQVTVALEQAGFRVHVTAADRPGKALSYFVATVTAL